MAIVAVNRDENPAIIKQIGDLSEVPKADDVIVFHGRTRRIQTYLHDGKFKRAVKARFMRMHGFDWNTENGCWAKNGDEGLGRVVINL
ncbi:hypothetical protein HQ571_03235 [Candidatus Kuenenbacteria bacterium]|nr:hypothetical protein [Candidatus Kuenenbacteria bacterium]